MRRGEQAINQLPVRLGVGVADERLDFLGSWRKPDQVERQPADQGSPVGLGGGLKTAGLEFFKNERINIRRNLSAFGRLDRLKRPPIAPRAVIAGEEEGVDGVRSPFRPRLDPIAERGLLLFGQGNLGRHFAFDDPVPEKALSQIRRHHGGSGLAPLKRRLARTQVEFPLGFRSRVAIQAVADQDRSDLAVEVVTPRRDRRENQREEHAWLHRQGSARGDETSVRLDIRLLDKG